jgi:hypothetical protein
MEGMPQMAFGDDMMKIEEQEFVGKEEEEIGFEPTAMAVPMEHSPLPQPVSPSAQCARPSHHSLSSFFLQLN